MGKLKRNYLLDILLLLLGIVPTILSFYIDMKLSIESNYWFQRSGSLMVLCAVLIELNAINYKEVIASKNTYIGGKPVVVESPIPKFKQYIKFLGLAMAVVGTFIWGYGDLPFKP